MTDGFSLVISVVIVLFTPALGTELVSVPIECGKQILQKTQVFSVSPARCLWDMPREDLGPQLIAPASR